MQDFQREKAIVRDLYAAIATAAPETVAAALGRYASPDWRWRGVHPFGERRGAEAVAAAFWAPLLRSMTRLQRRPDIFMAGDAKGAPLGVWVVEMGHLMGLFDRPWLGIRPTGRIAMLRYVEFNRVEVDENGDRRVAETALFVDLAQFLWQVGQYPLPPATGVHLVQPGPATHDGVMHTAQDPAPGAATMAAIEALLANHIPAHDPDEAKKLAPVWHDDMIWWGPGGIGATYTIDRYVAQHCRPFDDGLAEGYSFTGEMCRLSEGSFGGFFGWSNLRVRNAGGYLGMTAGPGHAEMALVDLYRAHEGKLAENWVFIDILGFLAQQGLDVLGRLESVG